MRLRVDPERIADRATHFPFLRSILTDDWFCYELRKPYAQWSLITGWLNAPDEDWAYWYQEWVVGLERALCKLQQAMRPPQFDIIRKKVCAHGNRTQFKSVLSEIALCMFIVSQTLDLSLEEKIKPGSVVLHKLVPPWAFHKVVPPEP